MGNGNSFLDHLLNVAVHRHYLRPLEMRVPKNQRQKRIAVVARSVISPRKLEIPYLVFICSAHSACLQFGCSFDQTGLSLSSRGLFFSIFILLSFSLYT